MIPFRWWGTRLSLWWYDRSNSSVMYIWFKSVPNWGHVLNWGHQTFRHTKNSSCCLQYTNDPQSTHQRKVAVCTNNKPLIIYPWLQNIENYHSTIQQSIMLFRRMDNFFRGSLDNLQMNNYSQNSIISILYLTTIFSISINWNILRQTRIYSVPYIPIRSRNWLIHTCGILGMIVKSMVFVEVGNMIINNHP